MSADIIDGKAHAERMRGRIKEEVTAFRADGHGVPGLAAVLVGDDPASEMYVNMKHRACEAAGIYSRQIKLGGETSQDEVFAALDELNADDAIDGILVQLPLPLGLNPQAVIERLDPSKDVDGLHPITAGRLLAGDPTFIPATPYGVFELLKDAGAEISGAETVIIGRSNLVGRPLSVLLSLKGTDATVTVAHSRTEDLPAVCRRADILVAAVGVPKLVLADWVKPGAVVIDVGTNRLDDGSLAGDVDFDAVKDVAGAVTPVPGGVGPMTVTMLLQNTLEAARGRRGLARR